MTLSKFIVKLQLFEAKGYGNLPVAIADWQERYREPSVEYAERISCENGKYICIGGDVFADVKEEIENLGKS